MLAFVLRRFALFVPTLLGITFLSFALLHLVPGDPAEFALSSGGENSVDAEALARFRATYLLDQPLWRQYLHYVGPFDLSREGHPWFGGSGARPYGGLLLGDLKHEIQRPGVPIAEELGRRLRLTLPLATLALLLAYLVAVPLGLLAAQRAGGRFDRASLLGVLLLYCVPSYWAALMLQFVFGAQGLAWLPALGAPAPGAPLLERLQHYCLPVLCLSYGTFAYLSRQMRSGMLETLGADFVRTARAKGLPERIVIGKHALRSAILPLATQLGGILPALVGGSIVVETIFDLPGVGRYAFEGLLQRDYFVVLATTTLGGAMTCLGLFLADLLTAALDPRIRHG